MCKISNKKAVRLLRKQKKTLGATFLPHPVDVQTSMTLNDLNSFYSAIGCNAYFNIELHQNY